MLKFRRSVDSLISSMRAHVGTLTSNITSVRANLTQAWGKMSDNAKRISGHDADLVEVTSNVTENRRVRPLISKSFPSRGSF